MHPSFVPPREVDIHDAASFVGITPQAIRDYEEIGLLRSPEQGGDGRRHYGHVEVVRLLWIRRMADARMGADDIRGAFADPADAAGDHGVSGVRVRMGLLADLVTGRLAKLPEGSLRQTDLDTLLVIERIFGPLGAAIHAARYVALATHPRLREESDRVDAAEDSLDDTVDVDDPRVARVAAERHAFELELQAVIEDSGLAQNDEALFDSLDALHPAADGAAGPDSDRGFASAVEAAGRMPYDFSPARLRCMGLAEEMAALGWPDS